MPDTGRITKIEEPFIEATILTNDAFLGGILPLLDEKRGVQKKFEYITTDRVMLVYELPLNEIVLDFYDRLKSVSKGYASLDYHLSGYQESNLVKLDVLVSGEPVDALSLILHRDTADRQRPHSDRQNEGIDPAPNVRGRRSRLPSATRSSPAKPSRQWAKTSSPNAMAATFRENANCSKSKKRVRSE